MKIIKIVKKKLEIDGQKKVLTIKGLHSNIKAVNADPAGDGVIEAYVSVFGNVDSYGDIVEPGAFADAVIAFNTNGRYPKGIWAHDWSMPIAKTLEMREDERGLYIKAQLILSVPKAQEAYDLIKAGVMTDFSFGYEINGYDFDDRGFRHLRKVTIYEWSPVLVGANNQATLISSKSAGKDQPIEEEEVEVPDETPETEVPVIEAQTPPGDTPPVDPVPEGETEEEKKSREMGEKAGRVLSAKNVSLIKEALSSIDTVTTELTSIKSTFEALISAVEEPDPEKGTGKGVDQPDNKDEVKQILKGVRQADKIIEKSIIRLKRLS